MEEPIRQMFGSGKAVFMRNWPYAWTIYNTRGSPVFGKVGLAPLPSFPGQTGVSALGGWQLGVNAYFLHAEAAEKLVLSPRVACFSERTSFVRRLQPDPEGTV